MGKAKTGARDLSANHNVDDFDDLTGDLIKLEPGQRVIGKFTGSNLVAGDEGEYHIFSFVDSTGAYKIPGTVQIAAAMEHVKEGSTVYIERIADGKSNRGRTVQNFKIKVKPA